MSSGPRFRFAPSPTGFFHVGGARTALYNWALAKRLGGTFVLRIEDTDEARNKPEWTDGIIDALAWLAPAWREQHEQRHDQTGHGRAGAERGGLLPAEPCFDGFEGLMLGCARDDQLLGGVGGAAG